MTLDRKKPVKSNGRKSIPSLHEAWRSQSHLSPASGRDDHKPPKIDTFSHVKWLSEKEGFLPIIFPSNSMLCLIISLSGSYSSSCLEPETLQVRIQRVISSCSVHRGADNHNSSLTSGFHPLNSIQSPGLFNMVGLLWSNCLSFFLPLACQKTARLKVTGVLLWENKMKPYFWISRECEMKEKR